MFHVMTWFLSLSLIVAVPVSGLPALRLAIELVAQPFVPPCALRSVASSHACTLKRTVQVWGVPAAGVPLPLARSAAMFTPVQVTAVTVRSAQEEKLVW